MLRNFNKDKVSLVKADGMVAKEQVPALVTGEMIFTADKALPVEVGDFLLRDLPNGLVEKYEVVNPTYFDNIRGMGAHFQIKVARVGSAQAQAKVVQTITNNFNGPNSRINLNSTDNSTNISKDFSPKELRDFISQVRPVISQLPEGSQDLVESNLKKVEDEAEKIRPDNAIVFSALQSIRSVAEGASGNLVAAGIVSLVRTLL